MESHLTDQVYVEKKCCQGKWTSVLLPPHLGTSVSCFFFSANTCVDGFKKRRDFSVDYSICCFVEWSDFLVLEAVLRDEAAL